MEYIDSRFFERNGHEAKQRNPKKIPGHSIKSFKGLEGLFFILADVTAPGEHRGFQQQDLYTSCTRAKFGLYFVPTVSGEANLKQLFAAEEES